MKLRNTIIAGAVIIVLLSLALIFIPSPKDAEGPQEVSFTQETANMLIEVEYTTFGYEGADEALKAIIEEYVNGFRGEVVSFGPSVTGRPYTLSIEEQQQVETEETVGTTLLVYQDFGGAHGLPQFIGINFYKENGGEVPLAEALDRLELTLSELSGNAQAYFEEEIGDSLFVAGLEPTEENYSSFLLKEDAVTFYFQPYQIAAYALGIQEYTISY